MERGLRAAATIAAFLAVSPLAVAADPPITQGLPLSTMHARLLQAGWKPAAAPVHLTLQGGGDAGALHRAGYPVQECAGTGSNPCIFNYTKQTKCLRVVTRGEYNPPEYEPVVDNWSFQCPGKK